MNKLSAETSPYLLQHANNPVHWKAWNKTTLDIAKESNKLIVISIGYSACHWCHVMEHESFEDIEVSQSMNDNFISIKVDREERPDIDAVYMKAIQIMTGRGGWPLNIVALPDGRPIWGGTYFQKPDWINSLEQLHKLYESNPEKMIEYAEKLHQGLETISLVSNENQNKMASQEDLIPLIEKWKKSFDWEFGGMARAPKFMMPNNYKFLMHYGFQYKDQVLIDFVDLTLTKMAYGGLFDTVDGGFSRYSVDMKWHVPHFEKMLYDNGQLVSLYADAYKRTKNQLFKNVIVKTLAFISKELTNVSGGFYCALDADSLNDNQKLEEGAFYVWKKQELQTILINDFDLFCIVFNINSFGYWEHDNYVLIQNQSLKIIAEENQIDLAELENKKEFWEQLLYKARENRSKPRLDDKCLTSWNAIMIKGFVDAYKALQNEDYLRIAIQNANFLIKNLWAAEGHLWHSYKNGKSTINGFLEDYAFLIEAFISIYEVTFEEQWLHHAKQLTDYTFEHFFEKDNVFFSFTSNLDEQLIVKHFEVEDNVMSASNSIMANNLYKLSIYFNNSHYKKTGQDMINHILPTIDYPSAFSNWLDVFLHFSDHSKELAICGLNSLDELLKINAQYFPQIVIAGSKNDSNLPFLKNRYIQGRTLLYLCQNKSCKLPFENLKEVYKELLH